MPSKKDPILLALGECPEKWNAFLKKTYGLAQDPQPRYEVSESAFVTEDGSRISLEGLAARQIRIGEEPPKGLFKVWSQHSGMEEEPNEQWRRSQAFMRALAWIYAHEKKLSEQKRADLLKDINDIQPTSCLPVFDEVLGTPEEFLERWRCHEVDVRFIYKNRDTQIFEIRLQPIPPDEHEDLDEADEPRGHWEGLTWTPD